MDSVSAPLLTQESMRSPVGYLRLVANEPPSRDDPARLVSERFQFEPNGQLRQLPSPAGEPSPIGSRIAREELAARLPAAKPRPQSTIPALAGGLGPGPSNLSRAVSEWNARNRAVMSSQNSALAQQTMNTRANLTDQADFAGVAMRPLWVDGCLVLARRVELPQGECIQGCLLDWPALGPWLIGQIADLLPDASLRPAGESAAPSASRMLASLPIELEPGRFTRAEAASGPLPIVPTLCLAWAGVLIAAVAVAVLLLGIVRLSNRRSAFVSAVTHELRTPLTTLRMYAEMLAEGMVAEPERQQHYFDTLHSETDRLGHLVDNVLAYARLERHRPGKPLETRAVGELLDEVQNRLAARAAQAGMELVVEAEAPTAARAVHVNPSSFDQILFNLVDNACKYAAGAQDRRIHLSVEHVGGQVSFRLRDHGPGVDASVRRRLFRPFTKSASEAADSAPGVGLGLALSRRLARDMGGQLALDAQAQDGTAFVLRLPLAAQDCEG
jgi:signal transduction histidine kinase